VLWISRKWYERVQPAADSPLSVRKPPRLAAFPPPPPRCARTVVRMGLLGTACALFLVVGYINVSMLWGDEGVQSAPEPVVAEVHPPPAHLRGLDAVARPHPRPVQPRRIPVTGDPMYVMSGLQRDQASWGAGLLCACECV
jgi:hypothetical protein